MKHHIKEDKGRHNNDRDRMLEDFWQRKKEAEANKARVSEAIAGPSQVLLKSILYFIAVSFLHKTWKY